MSRFLLLNAVASGELMTHVEHWDEHEQPCNEKERPIKGGGEEIAEGEFAVGSNGNCVGHKDVKGDEDSNGAEKSGGAARPDGRFTLFKNGGENTEGDHQKSDGNRRPNGSPPRERYKEEDVPISE